MGRGAGRGLCVLLLYDNVVSRHFRCVASLYTSLISKQVQVNAVALIFIFPLAYHTCSRQIWGQVRSVRVFVLCCVASLHRIASVFSSPPPANKSSPWYHEGATARANASTRTLVNPVKGTTTTSIPYITTGHRSYPYANRQDTPDHVSIFFYTVSIKGVPAVVGGFGGVGPVLKGQKRVYTINPEGVPTVGRPIG